MDVGFGRTDIHQRDCFVRVFILNTRFSAQVKGVAQCKGINIDDRRNKSQFLYLVDVVLEKIFLDGNQNAFHLVGSCVVFTVSFNFLAVDGDFVAIEGGVFIRLEPKSLLKFIVIKINLLDVLSIHLGLSLLNVFLGQLIKS